LADGSVRAWAIALGPLLLIYLLRAIFIGMKSEPVAREAVEEEIAPPPRRAPVTKEAPKRTVARAARVEPRIGRD
jgi:hypothetical protein